MRNEPVAKSQEHDWLLKLRDEILNQLIVLFM